MTTATLTDQQWVRLDGRWHAVHPDQTRPATLCRRHLHPDTHTARRPQDGEPTCPDCEATLRGRTIAREQVAAAKALIAAARAADHTGTNEDGSTWT